MSWSASSDELGVIEQLKKSVESIVAKTGPSSKFSKDLVKRIGEMQSKLESLAETDRHVFLAEMKDKFQQTIGRIEERIVQHAHFAQTYSSSIVSAGIFLLVSIFALFGYKLYKSLTEKELKKQEKLKSKQQKKAKKSN
ncbi:uncharacterized protein LOC6733975 isoform X2 [Drosophila simulans]|uniref:GD25919 n=2 Tax=melanogaster subgroup TaxID=32351 RepID=B4QB71_DROSI|nr:uncharacterized protein LOC6733975 isoform X2 [Drosophila simulans]XP_033154588.1 uncharacterized protein LOC117137313 isoform X2 [Drosophila mauritiana]EDX06604.1 GD25919 [Drosophila simulans]KMY92961.1 uncharacterized protein Dsimw501_GD25919, isoform A [Drosophila simulans]